MDSGMKKAAFAGGLGGQSSSNLRSDVVLEGRHWEIHTSHFDQTVKHEVRSIAEDGGVEPQPGEGSIRLANGARATARSIFQQRKVQESNPDALAPPGFRDRCLHHADRTFQSYSRRESNPFLRIESAPSSAIGPRERRAPGWTRTSSPSFGDSGHVHVRRRRGVGGSSRASGGNRTRDSRVAGACLTAWRPMRGSGARTRTSIAGVKGQHPAVGRHLIDRRRAVTRGRTEPSRIPGERAVPRSP